MIGMNLGVGDPGDDGLEPGQADAHKPQRMVPGPGGKYFPVPYNGHKVGLEMEPIVACIGETLEKLEEALYSDPDNISLQAAKWWIEEAIIKIAAGEPVNPYELKIDPIEGHQYYKP